MMATLCAHFCGISRLWHAVLLSPEKFVKFFLGATLGEDIETLTVQRIFLTASTADALVTNWAPSDKDGLLRLLLCDNDS